MPDETELELQTEPNTTTLDENRPTDTTSPRADDSKTAYLVLVGSAVGQIPVWAFQVSFGVFQDYESKYLPFHGEKSTVRIVGTTMIGAIYISMPFFSALLARYPRCRTAASLVGGVLAALGLLVSAFATEVWQLLMAQGVLHGLGASLLYTSLILNLNTWFIRRKGLGLGVTLATKAGLGGVTPFISSIMLNTVGYKIALYIWAAIVLATSIPVALFVRPRRVATEIGPRHNSPGMAFLKHPTAWIFVAATAVFSMGYGIPQNYIPSYASSVLKTSQTLSSSTLAMQNVPNVPASVGFGMLCDSSFSIRGHRMGARGVMSMSLLGAAIPVFLLWGLSAGSVVVLVFFNILYGFFAGGFSATWSGVIKLVEREGVANGEPVDTGIVFGLLNGGRGIGYVVGGLIGAQLLEQGPLSKQSVFSAYGTRYGGMILFTGLTAVISACGLLWRRNASVLH